MFQAFSTQSSGGPFCGRRPHFQREDHHAHFARFFGGREGGPRSPFGGRGFGGPGFGGGGRERMFDTGEFQLVILSLLAEKPSYGYELIKTLEGRLAGGYAPSPGVVYPTLTMLEEEGLTEAGTQEGGKKVYTVTDAGRKHLEDNKARVHEILERLTETGEGFAQGRSKEFRHAFKDLQRSIMGAGVRARATHGGLSAEQMRKIVAAIEAAAKAIDEL